MKRSSRAPVVGCLAVALLGPSSLPAQTLPSDTNDWTREAGYLSTNALVGALTAGVRQELSGGSFRDGFTRGALGGGVAYAGRRLAVEPFFGAGFLGRQVSALGAAVVRNASEARATFGRLFFPVGPVNVHVTRDDGGTRLRPKVNATALAYTLGGLFSADYEIDLSESLSSGAAVFRAPDRFLAAEADPVSGVAAHGVIFVSGRARGSSRTLLHERVHVLQSDFAFFAWSDPAEAWAAKITEPGRFAYRYVDFNVAFPLGWGGFREIAGIHSEDDPVEIEAEFLERR